MPVLTALKIKLTDDPSENAAFSASSAALDVPEASLNAMSDSTVEAHMKNLRDGIEGYFIVTSVSPADVKAMSSTEALQLWITDDATDADMNANKMGAGGHSQSMGSGLMFGTKTKAELVALSGYSLPDIELFVDDIAEFRNKYGTNATIPDIIFENKITKSNDLISSNSDLDSYHITVGQLLGVPQKIGAPGSEKPLRPDDSVPGFRYSAQSFDRATGTVTFANSSVGSYQGSSGGSGARNGLGAWGAFNSRNEQYAAADSAWANNFGSSVFVKGYTNKPASASDFNIEVKYYTDPSGNNADINNSKYTSNDRIIDLNITPINKQVSPINRYIVRLYGEYVISSSGNLVTQLVSEGVSTVELTNSVRMVDKDTGELTNYDGVTGPTNDLFVVKGRVQFVIDHNTITRAASGTGTLAPEIIQTNNIVNAGDTIPEVKNLGFRPELGSAYLRPTFILDVTDGNGLPGSKTLDIFSSSLNFNFMPSTTPIEVMVIPSNKVSGTDPNDSYITRHAYPIAYASEFRDLSLLYGINLRTIASATVTGAQSIASGDETTSNNRKKLANSKIARQINGVNRLANSQPDLALTERLQNTAGVVTAGFRNMVDTRTRPEYTQDYYVAVRNTADALTSSILQNDDWTTDQDLRIYKLSNPFAFNRDDRSKRVASNLDSKVKQGRGISGVHANYNPPAEGSTQADIDAAADVNLDDFTTFIMYDSDKNNIRTSTVWGDGDTNGNLDIFPGANTSGAQYTTALIDFDTTDFSNNDLASLVLGTAGAFYGNASDALTKTRQMALFTVTTAFSKDSREEANTSYPSLDRVINTAGSTPGEFDPKNRDPIDKKHYYKSQLRLF